MLVAYDLETWGVDLSLYPTPPIVCASWQVDGEAPQLIAGAHNAVITFAKLLKAGHDIGGANFTFDLGCLVAAEPGLLPKVFAALDAGKLHDVALLERLHDNASGQLGAAGFNYSLAELEQRHFGRKREDKGGPDAWRLRYHELDGVPLAQWPAAARDYPLADARGTLELLKVMLGPDRFNVACEAQEMRAAWALKLDAIRGIRTDPNLVPEIAAEIDRDFLESRERFLQYGFIVRRKVKGGKEPEEPDGFSDEFPGGFKYAEKREPLAHAVSVAYGGNPPRTETGGVQCDADALAESGDPILEDYGEHKPSGKLRSTYVPILKRGLTQPIHVTVNSFLETARCSYRQPNLQNLPRKGRVREGFIPRPGMFFCSTDYSTLELCTLAQVCYWLFGKSDLRTALNAEQDLHTRLAARVLGLTYEDALAKKAAKEESVSRTRQAMKEVNFGLPGKMGPPKLVLRARKAGIRFCESAGVLPKDECGTAGKIYEYCGRTVSPTCVACLELAQKYRRLFFEEWPEVAEYHECVDQVAQSGEAFESMSRGKMLRFTTNPNAIANHYFQNLAAVGAKDAGVAVRWAFYTPGTALYGKGAGVLFVHDENIPELWEETAHEAALEQSRLQCAVLQEHVPDVTIRAPPALMRRWLKEAEPVYVAGRLVPWSPAGA